MRGHESDPGLVPRAALDMFSAARRALDQGRCAISMSYLEIYNEASTRKQGMSGWSLRCMPTQTLRDLLQPGTPPSALRLVEDPPRSITVANLAEPRVASVQEVMRLLRAADARREVASTHMNAHSSRSHTIVRFAVAMWPEACRGGPATSGLPPQHVGTLSMVDLAGSERLKRTGSVGQQLEEARHINTSLMHLGVMVHRLSQGAKLVPYRESKLTRLLAPCLGGNALTVIICCISADTRVRAVTAQRRVVGRLLRQFLITLTGRGGDAQHAAICSTREACGERGVRERAARCGCPAAAQQARERSASGCLAGACALPVAVLQHLLRKDVLLAGGTAAAY